MDWLWLSLGLGVLVIGADLLVRGAVGFSAAMKISPLVVGMTVVAFGTSAPELIVSLTSAMGGTPEIAVGNVVGSNIVNISLILGVTVMIFPIMVNRQTTNIDLPVMLASTFLMFFFLKDGEVSLFEGIIMFAGIILFTYLLIRDTRIKTKAAEKAHPVDTSKQPANWKSAVFLTLGFVGLYFGAQWFVKGAVGIANVLLAGNPDKNTIIGVTVVAIGTSMPEFVASVVAAYRKQSDIAIGNLIGSNIFNILCVLGLTAVIAPVPVAKTMIESDMIWAVVIAILLILLIAIGNKLGRIKGAILIASYVVYIYLILINL